MHILYQMFSYFSTYWTLFTTVFKVMEIGSSVSMSVLPVHGAEGWKRTPGKLCTSSTKCFRIFQHTELSPRPFFKATGRIIWVLLSVFCSRCRRLEGTHEKFLCIFYRLVFITQTLQDLSMRPEREFFGFCLGHSDFQWLVFQWLFSTTNTQGRKAVKEAGLRVQLRLL